MEEEKPRNETEIDEKQRNQGRKQKIEKSKKKTESRRKERS